MFSIIWGFVKRCDLIGWTGRLDRLESCSGYVWILLSVGKGESNGWSRKWLVRVGRQLFSYYMLRGSGFERRELPTVNKSPRPTDCVSRPTDFEARVGCCTQGHEVSMCAASTTTSAASPLGYQKPRAIVWFLYRMIRSFIGQGMFRAMIGSIHALISDKGNQDRTYLRLPHRAEMRGGSICSKNRW